jgi:anaerobic magnesium-protoporphyrin IX monomethyl ester cyclase
MSVLLGQGYSLRLDPKLRAAGQPYAPLAALYAAALLRARGHSVALHDAMVETSDGGWEAALDRHHPRWAVLYEDAFSYLAKMCLSRAREAALGMIRAARRRGCAVLVSGPDATATPGPYLAAGAERVIPAGDERALADAVGGCSTGVPSRDLDDLPPPAWDLVDVGRYRRLWKRRHGYFSMNAVSSRGCPYRCNWCATPVQAGAYAAHSPARVAADVARLKREFAPDHLQFVDDIFGLKPGWLEELADRLRAADAVIPFKCLTRADRLDEPTVRALRRAGCRTVWMGAESGSQRILDAMDKGTTVDQIRVAARRLRAHGIEVGLFLQFGYPGEGRAEIEETRALVRDCAPDDIGISVAYPLAGTRFHAQVAARLGARRNWFDSDDLAMMYEGPFATSFYRALHRLVHRELRARRRSWRGLLAAAALPLDRWRLARRERR